MFVWVDRLRRDAIRTRRRALLLAAAVMVALVGGPSKAPLRFV